MASLGPVPVRGLSMVCSFAALLLAGGWLACRYSPDIEPGTLHCSQDGACPDGFSCVLNYCEKPTGGSGGGGGGGGGKTGGGGSATGGSSGTGGAIAATGGTIVTTTGGIGAGGKATGGAATGGTATGGTGAGTGGTATGGSGTGGQRTGGTGTGGAATGGAATGGVGTGGAGTGGANSAFIGEWRLGSDAVLLYIDATQSYTVAASGEVIISSDGMGGLLGSDRCSKIPLVIVGNSTNVSSPPWMCQEATANGYRIYYIDNPTDIVLTVTGANQGTYLSNYSVEEYNNAATLTDSYLVQGSASVTRVSASAPP